MMHHDIPTFISITWVRALTIMLSIISIMAGLVVEMLFMLFAAYNMVGQYRMNAILSTAAILAIPQYHVYNIITLLHNL